MYIFWIYGCRFTEFKLEESLRVFVKAFLIQDGGRRSSLKMSIYSSITRTCVIRHLWTWLPFYWSQPSITNLYDLPYIYVCIYYLNNKEDRRGLIAATGLVILFKLDSNRRFFDSYDHEIWWMTSQKIGHLFCTMPSFVHHFKAIGAFKLELQSGNAHFGSKLAIFVPCDLEFWWMTLKNKRTPLLCYFKLCASFCSHPWIQTWVTVRECPIWVKHDDVIRWKHFPRYWPFVGGIHWSLVNSPHKDQGVGALMFSLICSWTNGWVNNRDAGDVRRHCAYYGVTVFKLTIFVLFDLEVWRMTLKNNRAPMPHQALCMISSPYINSNWSYGPERLNWVLTYVTLTCDLDLVHGYHFCHW